MNNTNSAAGIINGWTNGRADDQFLCFSVGGYEEITEISKEFIKGHFEYNAVIVQGVDLIDTVRVNNGAFFVPINVVSGKAWDGPQ